MNGPTGAAEEIVLAALAALDAWNDDHPSPPDLDPGSYDAAVDRQRAVALVAVRDAEAR
jgi:hypothetical protein